MFKIMSYMRRKTRKIKVRTIGIGGDSPISVQSMTNTKTTDVEATLRQIQQLEEAGCEIVRVAVPSKQAAESFEEIRKRTDVPLVADIHFDYRLALMSIDAGADKIRINPGNIGSKVKLRQVTSAASGAGIPIRVGVNAGSLEKDLIEKYGGPTVDGLVESAVRNVEICQEFSFEDIVLSLKASDVLSTVSAYRKVSKLLDLPLHLGVTEAGTVRSGSVKSAVAMGILLSEGIGDTLRVSLTSDPVEEVKVAFEILKSLDLRQKGITLISCPTCSRAEVDIVAIANEVEQKLAGYDKSLRIAVMGCVVNGPGESKEADIGVACGKNSGVIFKKGKVVGKVREQEIVDTLVREVENWNDSD